MPTSGWGYKWGNGPAWDSAYLLIPWYLYLYRGDVRILEELGYEQIKISLKASDVLKTVERFEQSGLSSDARQLARYFFCKAIRVEPDKQARITISNDLRAFAGLNGEAVVVGVNDRIEIWEPGRYREVDDALLSDVDAVSERMGDSFPCAA